MIETLFVLPDGTSITTESIVSSYDDISGHSVRSITPDGNEITTACGQIIYNYVVANNPYQIRSWGIRYCESCFGEDW